MAYVAHIPPLEGWYSIDSLCYGAGARMAYITAKAKKNPKVKRGTTAQGGVLVVLIFQCRRLKNGGKIGEKREKRRKEKKKRKGKKGFLS